MVAFNFMIKSGQLALRLAAETFSLIDSKYLFLNKAKELITNNMYKEACQIAIELELHDEFTIYDIVLPLILQDKKTIAEEYLQKSVKLRQPLVELLDSLLEKFSSIPCKCQPFIEQYNYKDLKLQTVTVKFLNRFITRLSKEYNISRELTPNLNRIQTYGALQLLIYKKYVQKSLNYDSWEEMIKITIPKNLPEFHMVVIDGCCDHHDFQEATKWALFFNMDPMQLPSYIRDLMSKTEVPFVVEDWDDSTASGSGSGGGGAVLDSKKVHTLNLENVEVIIVDTKELCDKMIEHLLQQQIIAMDSEWKPNFQSNSEVALIQLASSTKVFLVDVIVLDLSDSDWNRLGQYVFNNEEILKLGFSLSADLTLFHSDLPQLNLQPSHSSYLDLQDLWRNLNFVPNFRFPYHEKNVNNNLSNLVRLTLGKRLDKSNQFSNWEKRPLRKDQMYYAALDAYCLLEIYNVIQVALQQINIDITDFITTMKTQLNSSLMIKKSKKPKPPQKDRRIQKRVEKEEGRMTAAMEFANNCLPYVSAKDIKFVCSHMLEGLGRALRKIGIDTEILTKNDYFDDCAKIANRENRIILTRDTSYERLSQHVERLRCFNVYPDRVDEQVLEVIKNYKIVVKEEDVFSRCQLCNCGDFIMISSADTMELKTGKKSRNPNEQNIPITNNYSSRSWNLCK